MSKRVNTLYNDLMKNELVTSNKNTQWSLIDFKVDPPQKQKILDIGYLGAIQNIHDWA